MNIEYIRNGDYYIPDLKLPEETRPIGKWGRMHRDYPAEQTAGTAGEADLRVDGFQYH